MTEFNSRIRERLDALASQSLRRHPRVSQRAAGPRIRIDGRELLSFASNDYLGLRDDPRVVAALKRAADRYGLGAGAAHLLGGHHVEHAELERELADWLGRPAALLFSSGYQAALGALGALLERRDQVFEDRLNHACLIDGAVLARAKPQRYPHLDLDALAQLLQAADERPKLVISDSVFSMDGDVAPLAELAALTRQHAAWLMLDEAHALGVLGPHGAGAAAAAGLDVDAVPLLLGTLGKALGSFGAFISGSVELKEFLINQARTWIYTTALPPALAAATRESLRIARHEQWRRDRLIALGERLRTGLAQLSLATLPSTTPIQAVLMGSAQAALDASRQLEEAGLHVPAIRPPTVPEGSARLRISLSAAHSDADVDLLLGALEKLRPLHSTGRPVGVSSLHHQQFGSNGPKLVLLHGWGLHGAIFGPLIEQLQTDHELHVFDLPGHGYSRDPGIALDPVAVIAAVRAVVPQAHWLGWSLGGLIALRAALDQPAAVQSLILCAAGPCFVERPHWPVGMPLQVFESFAQDLATDWEGTLERFLVLETLGTAEPMHELKLLKRLAIERGAPQLAALQRGLDLLGGVDLSARLDQLGCRSLWIGGKRDRLVAPAALTAAVDRAPRARLELIERAGHAPFLTYPEQVAALVRNAVAAAEDGQ